MENSLSSFRAAEAEGFRYIETDVHATADGVVVVHHDADLARTTDGRGAIRRLPWRAVSQARIGGVEPVSRLDDVLEEFPDLLWNIDIKAASAIGPLLRVVRRHDAWHRVCLASFDETTLETLRRRGDNRMLTSMGGRSARILWTASRYGGWPLRKYARGFAAQVPQARGRLRVVDPQFIRQAHHWGVEVHVWTVDDADDMVALLDQGVDGLVTDRPDVLRSVLQQRGQFVGDQLPISREPSNDRQRPN